MSLNKFFRLWILPIHINTIQLEAAAMTFHSLLSLVPAIGLFTWIITTLPSAIIDIQNIEDLLIKIIVPDFAKIISKSLHSILAQSSIITLASIPLLLFACINLMHNMEKSLNRIFHAPPRKWYNKIIFLLVTVVFSPIILAMALAISNVLQTLTNLGWLGGLSHVTMINMFVEALLFSIIYRFVPTSSVPLFLSILGGCIVAICLYGLSLVLQKLLFGLGSYQIVYGVFASIPIFFLWIYFFWLTIFVSATMLYQIHNLHQH